MNQDARNTWTSDALQRGDVEAVKRRVLAEPEYIHDRDYVGDTPLMTAIEFDNLQLVEFLLQHGADPNAAVDDGYTCLLTAVEADSAASISIVEALIGAGADIRQAGIHGWTPLHMAAARGRVDKAKKLIAAGAFVNQRNEIDASETPLMEAAFAGQPETVQLLLDHGADASMRDTIGNRTPLEIAQHAAEGPDAEVYKFLQKEHLPVNLDELIADMDLPPEQMAMLKQTVQNFDMAENYLQNAQKLVETGNHGEVIKILTDYARERLWPRLYCATPHLSRPPVPILTSSRSVVSRVFEN